MAYRHVFACFLENQEVFDNKLVKASSFISIASEGSRKRRIKMTSTKKPKLFGKCLLFEYADGNYGFAMNVFSLPYFLSLLLTLQEILSPLEVH